VAAELDDIWSDIRTQLERAVGEATFGMWLEGLSAVALEGDTLVVSAPDEARQWVADRFARVLQASAAAVLGPAATVDLIPSSASHRARAEPAGDRRAERLNPKHTFDQFVIGDSNRLAHAAALAVAEQPGQAYNPLFLHGPPGVGKTHLLHSIAAYIETYGEGLSVRYTTVEAFTNQFVNALQSGSMDRFKALYRGRDVLLIDDVQFLEHKAKTEEELFHTFNELYELGSQLVLAADRLPRDLAHVEQRLTERFESGLVADITPPDFATRLTILRKRVRVDGVQIADPAALDVIADRVTANIRALEGALIRVVAFHSLTGRPIDAALATEVLDGLHGTRPRHHRSVREIQDAVCDIFQLSHDELVSDSRIARLTWPRQIGMYLSRELTDQTLPTIGRHFGGRNHATVLHAWKRTAARMSSERDAYDDVQRLLARLGDPAADRDR
jgi:chromosomal replication initiator protein